MDSSFNYRHTQTHRADLNQRAELHRLAARAREARQPKARNLRIPHPGAAVFALLSSARHAPHRARRA